MGASPMLLGTPQNAWSQDEFGMCRGRAWHRRAGQAFEVGGPDVGDGTTTKFIRRGLSRAATGWRDCQDEAPVAEPLVAFWTRARGQRELADERTGRLKSSARLQGLFKGGLDIPPTHVQFSSLRREHPSGRSLGAGEKKGDSGTGIVSSAYTSRSGGTLRATCAIRSRPPVNCVAASRGHRATDVRPGRL